MNNLPAVLIANGSAAMLLTVVMLSAWKTVHFGLVDHKLFLVSLLCSLLESLLEAGSFLVDGRPGLEGLALGINCVLFIDNLAFAFIWTLYVDFKLYGDMGRLKRVYPFVAIPALLGILGSAANLFTPVFFQIAPGNVYQRTGAYILPVVTVYAYIAYGVMLVYLRRNKVKRYLFLPVVVFVTPIAIASLLQFHFYGYSLVGIGTAIGLTSVYINVQNEVSLTDQLTGLFTRQYLMRYLNAQARSREDGRALTGIMLDIDNFKQINDTFGHLTGDQALVKAGEIIRGSVPRQTVAARYAGDEFVIVLPGESPATATDVLDSIRRKTAAENASGQNPYTLSFSAGYSAYAAGDTVESFLGRIDEEMYEDKKRSGKMQRRATDRDVIRKLS